jgi:hypothetical protein
MNGGKEIVVIGSDPKSKKFQQPMTPSEPLVHFTDQSRQDRRRHRKKIEIFRSKKKLPVQNQKEEDAFRDGKNP